MVQKEGLSSDLSLYLPGLTPTLSFAALSVKPNILALYENFIVTLKPTALRPALRSLILGLLPGLEEENSDEFERTLRILGYLKVATARSERRSAQGIDSSNDQYFWQCMFLACITSTSRRAGGLAYLTRDLPHLGAPLALETTSTSSGQNGYTNGSKSEETKLHQAIEAVVSPEPGLLIRCFCAGLRDEQLLTQRGFLDLLVTNLPLSSVVLQEKVVSEDLEKLIGAATSVVARRDMSLNRRLWSWFLGPEPVDTANGSTTSPTTPRSNGIITPAQDSLALQTRYFERYGLGPLHRSLQTMIKRESENPVERTKPLRICLSLMDRWEIGGLVIPQVFLPAMFSVCRYQKASTSDESRNEVLRSANMFFDGVESGLIWAELAKTVARAFDLDTTVSAAYEMLELVSFMTTHFNIREEEMQIVHIPLVTTFLLLQVHSWLQSPKANDALNDDGIVILALRIANKLLELIPQRALTSDKALNGEALGVDEMLLGKESRYSSAIEHFYRQKHGNVDTGLPFSPNEVGRILLHSSFELFSSLLTSDPIYSTSGLDLAVSMLTMAIRKGPKNPTNLEKFLSILSEPSGGLEESSSVSFQSFVTISAKISAFEGIMSTPHSSKWISERLLRQVVPALVAMVWPSTSPSRPKHNVEAVRFIWRLHAICSDPQLIESTIMSLMIHKSTEGGKDAIDHETARCFTILWTHSPITSTTPQSRRSSLMHTKSDLDQQKEAKSELSLLERPLMLFLDALEDPKCALFPFVVNWLQSLNSLVPYA